MNFFGMKLNGSKPKKRFNAAKHSSADAVCVYVSRIGGMDLSDMRSFTLAKKDGAWLLDADFFLSGDRVELEGCKIPNEIAAQIISLIDETGAIKKLAHYRPARVKMFALDAPTNYSRLTFADGEEISAAISLPQIERRLNEIAADYAEINNAAE